MNYVKCAVSIIVILILGLIYKENSLSPAVKIILSTIVGLITYCALNISSNEGFTSNEPSSQKTQTLSLKSQKLLSGELIPVGTIAMWSGAITEIPIGWALCNGDTVTDISNNNFTTPNLSGRFVAGYNTKDDLFNSIGKTAGNQSIQLLPAHLPQHEHSVDQQGITEYKCNAPINISNRDKIIFPKLLMPGKCQNKNEIKPQSTTISSNLPAISDKQNKTISCTNCNPDTPSYNNIGKNISILPPYYVLAYIIYIGFEIQPPSTDKGVAVQDNSFNLTEKSIMASGNFSFNPVR